MRQFLDASHGYEAPNTRIVLVMHSESNKMKLIYDEKIEAMKQVIREPYFSERVTIYEKDIRV